MDQIRAEAAVQRISIRRLADTAGVDYSTLRRYLAGTRVMDLDVLYRIAGVFGMDGASALMVAAEARQNGPAARPPGAAEAQAGRTRVGEILGERPSQARRPRGAV